MAEPQNIMKHIRRKRCKVGLGIRELGENGAWGKREGTLRYGQIFKELDTDEGKGVYARSCSYKEMGKACLG